jgi:hypothetical protein
MYKIASDKKQSALHRGKKNLSDWLNGEERLKVEDQFNQLRSSVKIIEERRKNSTDDTERKQLARLLTAYQHKVSEFKKAFKFVTRAERGIEGQFIVAAREMLLRAQYDAIYKEAEQRVAKLKQELEQMESPYDELDGK